VPTKKQNLAVVEDDADQVQPDPDGIEEVEFDPADVASEEDDEDGEAETVVDQDGDPLNEAAKAAVQAMELSIEAANADFERGDFQAARSHMEHLASQDGEARLIRKQISAFRQAYLARRGVLLSRAFDEVRDEVEGSGSASVGRSVSQRMADLLAATKKGLIEKGYDERTADEVARIMAQAQQQVARPDAAQRKERNKAYRAENSAAVRERLALRKEAARLAREG
jgi:hypothetical protein